MEIDDLDCPLCKCLYNMSIKIPRLLYKCGHTYCQDCLYSRFNEHTIECPDDKEVYTYENIDRVEDFPKNISLIAIIDKVQNRKMTLSLSANEGTKPRGSLNFTGENKHEQNFHNYSLHMPSQFTTESNTKINFEQRSTLNSLNSLNFKQNLSHNHIKDHKDKSIYTFTTEFKLNDLTNPSLTCSIHRRPLEIVCLDHKVKICTTCALFGDHKNHKIRSEEDMIKEVSIKAEILIQYYEIIDKHAEKLEEELITKETKLKNIKNSVKTKSEKNFITSKRII